MINCYCKKPLHESTRDLVDVCMGRVKADIVVKNASLIDVCTREIIKNTSVAIKDGRIAMVGNAIHTIGENTVVYDLKGLYLAPAFMDGHMHIESSMLTPSEYARVVVPHGTSAVFFDPHEICNVCGLDGVKAMLKDAKTTPLKAYLTTPSCVPAVPGFEDTGSFIGPKEVAESMTWPECVGLGEMMNNPGILNSDEFAHSIVDETLKNDKVVTGHFPIPDTDKLLNAYIACGINCDHESTTEEESISKMRLGMYSMFREGSAWHDLAEVSKAVTKHKIDSRYSCLVTDDSHPHTLVEKGHLDYVLKRAVEEGIDPLEAIQMVTINTASCFKLDHELGSITPSKCADMVVFSSLKDFDVSMVFINGEIVAKDGKALFESHQYKFPENLKNTVHLKNISINDLKIPSTAKKVDVHAIEIIPAKTITKDKIVTLDVIDGSISADSSKDIMKAVVFERHHNTNTKGMGFIKGFGIKNGAMAQTVSHDAHNLMVVGTNDSDMVLAANTLIKCGGGACAVLDGKVIGLIKLPIAGLMTDGNLDDAIKEITSLENAWKTLGCIHPSPFMTMGISSLACIPELRLTNRGLVDCTTYQFLPLVVKEY